MSPAEVTTEPASNRGTLRRNLRLCTIEGIFATPWGVLSIPGNIFVAALILGAFGVSKGSYGVIVSLPAWFNAFQLIAIPFLARFFSARVLNLAFGYLNVVVWMLLVFLLPHIPTDDPASAARILLLLWILISLTQSLTGVAWTSWVQEWIPSRIRGKYFGRRNSKTGLVTVAFLWVAGELIGWFDGNLSGYQWLLGAAGLLRIGSMWAQSRIHTPWSEPESMVHEGWRKRGRELLGDRNFVIFLIWGALLAFAFSFIGPFTPVFMTEHAGLTVAQQSLLMMLANLMAAVFLPLWGKWCDRFGSRNVITVSAILWMTQNYLWIAITPETRWLLYPMWLWGGATSGGVILGGFNLLLKIVPRRMKTAGISLNLMVTSLAAAVAPILSGSILQWANSQGIDSVIIFRIYFAVYPTIIMLGLFVLRRVDEPESRQISSVMGAFRSMRNALILEGIVIVANVTPIRPLRQRLRGVAKLK